jgi:homocysteine S-methyltransferase
MHTLLPQLQATQPFLTDGGLETTLVFLEGIDLVDFAAFPLLDTDAGRGALRRYFAPYLDLAARTGVGIVLDTPTWRANPTGGHDSATTRRALPRSTGAPWHSSLPSPANSPP